MTNYEKYKMSVEKMAELLYHATSQLASQAGRTLEALEKQIPKKPITETVNRGISVSGEYDIDFNYLCPNCNTVIGDYETDDVFYKFCPDCGQALDLSENNG